MILTLPRFICGAALAMVPCLCSTLCIQVTDLARQPLPNASVVLKELRGEGEQILLRTDVSGTACATSIPAGIYIVEAWKKGFLRGSFQPVMVSPEAPARLLILLPFSQIMEGGVALSATLAGTLTDENQRLVGVDVCILNGSKNLFCVTTNELGEYAFSIYPGEYVVRVTGTNGLLFETPVAVPGPGLYRNLLQRGSAAPRHVEPRRSPGPQEKQR